MRFVVILVAKPYKYVRGILFCCLPAHKNLSLEQRKRNEKSCFLTVYSNTRLPLYKMNGELSRVLQDIGV